MPTGQDFGQCWLRGDVVLSACWHGLGYDTWTRPATEPMLAPTPAPTLSPTSASISQAPMPSPSPVSTSVPVPQSTPKHVPAPSSAGSTMWQEHESVNCYDGHGARGIESRSPARAMSLEDCQAACETEAFCEAIVVRSASFGGPSPCWLRADVDLSACVSGYADFTTWSRF